MKIRFAGRRANPSAAACLECCSRHGQRLVAILILVISSAGLMRSQDEVRTRSAASFTETSTNRVSHSSEPAGYIISADDVLDIDVLDVPEISRSYRVSAAGTVTLPMLSLPVRAAGLGPEQLSDTIAKQLQAAGMVSHPYVSVQVKESRTHSIAVMGAVRKPLTYPLFGTTTLVAALSQAEGLAEDAGTTAIITRGDITMGALDSSTRAAIAPQTDSSVVPGPAPVPLHQAVTVDLVKLLEKGDGSLNLNLYPGDQVTVQRAGIVYVVGAVHRAGGFVLKNDRQQMTVLKAVAMAENLTSTAVPRKAMIIRKTGGAQDQELPVDLSSILAGHGPDRVLLADDILFVPDSSGKKALHRAGEAAAQAAALFVYRVP